MAAPVKTTILNIDTKRTVIRLSGLSPSVGLESSASNLGFQYDLKAWEASPIDETIEPFAVLPRYLAKPLVGIPEAYYQSGIEGEPEVQADLELQKIELDGYYTSRSQPADDSYMASLAGINYQKPWLPKLWHGTYYLNDEDYYLYSDESIVQTVQVTENQEDRNFILLDKTPKAGVPISVRMYERDEDWVVRTYRAVEVVDKFSGRIDDGEELDTETATGAIDWDNVETNIPEVYVSLETTTPSLLFNNDWTKTIGYEPADYEELPDLEILGVSTGLAGQKFYTKYFPILHGTYALGPAGDPLVYVVDYVGETFTLWSRVDSSPTINNYTVDKDYGIIQFGSDFSIPPEGHYIYISYVASLRVEYEEDETTDIVTGLKANVSPTLQSLNAGFIAVGGYDDSPDTITLEASDLSVEIATELSFLTAEVLSRSGRPCRDIDVYFEFFAGDDVGTIGGIRPPAAFLGRTNAAGLARTYYRPPSSIEDLTWYTSTISSTTQGLVLPAGAVTDPFTDDHIYTYAIYRDDPLMGKVDADTTIGEVEWTTTPRPNGRKVLLYVQTTSNSWKDPITGVPAAGPTPIYRPLTPGSFDTLENSLEYSHVFVVPETGDTVTSTWIGGYAVVASRSVTVRAYCFSERLGTYIYSNEVDIVITLPERMRGTYIESGKARVPFGWRIYDDSYTIASAITAATYLGINPRAGAYPIIDVIADEEWDGTSPSDSLVEAEYAFGRLHFVFEVT